MAPNCDLEVVKSVLFSGWFLSFPPSQLHSFPCLSGVTRYFSPFLSYVKKESYIYSAPSLRNLPPLPYRSQGCLVSPPSPPAPCCGPSWEMNSPSTWSLTAQCLDHQRFPLPDFTEQAALYTVSRSRETSSLLRRYQPNVKKKTAEAKRCKLGRAQSQTSHPLLLGPSHPQHFQHHYHPPQIITWETRARLVILRFNLRPRSHDFPPQPTDQPPPPTGGKKKKLYTDIYM